MYLIGSLLVLLSFFSVSLSQVLFTGGSLLVQLASETIRSSLTVFFLLQQGQGRVHTEGGGGGRVNCRKIKEQRSQRAYNTATKAEKWNFYSKNNFKIQTCLFIIARISASDSPRVYPNILKTPPPFASRTGIPLVGFATRA